MNAAEAAHSLHEHLVTWSWFIAVGVHTSGGVPLLRVYVRGQASSHWFDIPTEWQGHPVDVIGGGA